MNDLINKAKKQLPAFSIRKLVYSLFPVFLIFQIVMWNTLNNFNYGFLITYILYLAVVWNIETKEKLRYYILNSAKILFFFMPVSAIIFTIAFTSSVASQSEGSLEAGASAVGGMIGGGVFILFTLVIGVIGGVILHFVNKKVEDKEEKSSKKIMNSGFFILYILITSLIWGILSSQGTAQNTSGNEVTNMKKTDNVSKEEESPKKTKKEEVDLNAFVKYEINDYKIIEGDYSNDFNFKFDVLNNSGKDIIGYQGYFEVYDSFGDSLGKFNLEKVGLFKNEEKLNEDLIYGFNQFLDRHTKLSKLTFDDLKIVYKIEKVIFDKDFNSEDKLLGANKGKDTDLVNYKIENKTAKKEGYSHLITYKINVKNNSEKEIKGIKGNFTVYNIFGDKINSYELYLTDKIAGSTTLTKEVDYDVNQFINRQLKAFETDFKFLKYNFDIENVVYSEVE